MPEFAQSLKRFFLSWGAVFFAEEDENAPQEKENEPQQPQEETAPAEDKKEGTPEEPAGEPSNETSPAKEPATPAENKNPAEPQKLGPESLTDVMQLNLKPIKSKKIFFICDDHADIRKDCLQALRDAGLKPIPIPNRLEAFKSFEERYGDYYDIHFAMVVLSPDQFSYPKDGKPADARLMTKSDAVLKLGYLLGKLKRSNIFLMHYEQKSFVFPGGFLGTISVGYNKKNSDWKKIFNRRLEAWGLKKDEKS